MYYRCIAQGLFLPKYVLRVAPERFCSIKTKVSQQTLLFAILYGVKLGAIAPHLLPMGPHVGPEGAFSEACHP